MHVSIDLSKYLIKKSNYVTEKQIVNEYKIEENRVYPY